VHDVIALFPLFLALTVPIILDMAATAFGADSREDFTEDKGPPGLR
jgi:hypothetical protein